MSNFRISRLERGLLATLAITGLFLACNGGILQPGTGNGSYRFLGLVTVDPNRDKTIAAAEFRKDTLYATTGSVKLDATALSFNRSQFAIDSVFSTEWNSVVQFVAGSHNFAIIDSTSLRQQSVTISLPTTASIIDIVPPSRVSNGSDLVKLSWFGGSGADGFVIAAVLKNRAYSGAGYAVYATSQGSETFPREAFYQSSPTTPDTGWYYLYVYAYTGSPDRVLSRATLPVRMPTQLTDNINARALSGHVGTVRVSIRDSVRVVLQP